MDFDSEDIYDFCESVGIPRAAMERLLSNLRNESLESLSDEDAPLEIHSLALYAQSESGQRITAIKRGSFTTYESSKPVADKFGWSLRRLSGRLRKSDPAVVERKRDCWYFVTTGNPVMLKDFLRKMGYNAIADSPNTTLVCEVGRERERDMELVELERWCADGR